MKPWGLLLLPALASAQVYNVDFSAGGGLESVTGTLTLSGGQVQSYALQGSGAQPFSYAGFEAQCALSCGFSESGDALYFNPNPGDGVSLGQSMALLGAARFSDPEFNVVTASYDGGYSFYLPSSLLVGVRSVPELSGGGLLGEFTLIIGFFLIARGQSPARHL